ncbi:methyltransferase [Microbacterium mangrovi]|uniref:Methyltransferase n=1 Tax=Microbacterium mangrovi TaxID=1348253 RepID=A0A0B2A7F6_9MICO|nr:16S rRNA (guanine(966)-N(2))-methyltransferase RsmD [Microbacterium mangrovi]KHK97482.1 methyltransferase [Microbacterium mangrovi]
MPRIIAGRAGGSVLAAPSSGTRPTSDRVRESLFAALESADALHGARVADLYAGTGALGLEALSRGAASADLVEQAPGAEKLTRANAARVLKAMGGAVPASAVRVHRQSVGTYVATAHGPFDLVFLDPPYDLGDGELARVLTALEPSLAPDALIVVERAARSTDPEVPAEWVAERTKRYGDTAIRWYRFPAEPQPRSESQS